MKNRKGIKKIMAALTGMVLLASRPATALADSAFEGDIIIQNAVAGYEYKVYDVFDVAMLGGEGMLFLPGQGWEDFAQTDEESLTFMVPDEEGYYRISPEATNAIARAFVESAMGYAEENGVEPAASMVPEEGQREITFQQLNLGLYVIDMSDGPAFTIMRDLEWVSTMKDQSKPANTPEPSTEAQESGTQEESKAQEEPAGAGSSAEESAAEEEPESRQESRQESEQESAAATVPAETERQEEGGSNSAVIVVAVVVIVAVAGVALVFVKKKK